jgi:8-oxo-dGTP pyrophosphatase MutT (NUDIX family)
MILPYEITRYQGAVLDISSLETDADGFLKLLEAAMLELSQQELIAVWLFLTPDQAHFITVAVSLGFTYHHADEKGIQLLFRFKPDAHIPGYATHFIGAGGVVVDDRSRLLVIQERFHTRKHYKLPGGAIEPNEHISTGVVREVLEETGIHTEFLSLNGFRHWHGYRYGKSDIYYICRLKPLTTEIVIDPEEISEAVWMPVAEYLTHPYVHPFNRKIVEAALNSPGMTLHELPGTYSSETHELFFFPNP